MRGVGVDHVKLSRGRGPSLLLCHWRCPHCLVTEHGRDTGIVFARKKKTRKKQHPRSTLLNTTNMYVENTTNMYVEVSRQRIRLVLWVDVGVIQQLRVATTRRVKNRQAHEVYTKTASGASNRVTAAWRCCKVPAS